MELLLKILNCAYTNYIYPRFIGPDARQLTYEETIECARALGVPNPLESVPQVLPPDISEYRFCGRIDDQNSKSHEALGLQPFLADRHPIYPNARPMAWIVEDDSMDEQGYIKGAIAYGVDFKDSGASLGDGDLVVIELTQHSLLGESTLIAMRVVKMVDGAVKFLPQSRNPASHGSITTNEKDLRDGTKIKILTLIHGGRIRHK